MKYLKFTANKPYLPKGVTYSLWTDSILWQIIGTILLTWNFLLSDESFISWVILTFIMLPIMVSYRWTDVWEEQWKRVLSIRVKPNKE